jgi:hypothetical protein
MYSRRKLLQYVGAAAGMALPGHALAQFGAPSRVISSEQNRVQVIDADFALSPYLDKIVAAGVKTVGRYYDRAYGTGVGDACWHNPTKTLTKDELTAIEGAGLSVMVVFEHCGANCMNFNAAAPASSDKGRKDGAAALQLASELGQPANTPIYFGIDFDPVKYGKCTLSNEQIWASIAAYFSEINELFAPRGLLVGVYGAGSTCQFLRDRRLAQFFWLSASLGHEGTDEFFNRGHWHLFQNRIDIQKDYGRKHEDFIDTNVVNPNTDPDGAYFGQWTTKGRAEVHDPATARDILESRAFFKRACGYGRDAKVKLSPKASRVQFDSTCRLMSEEGDGYFGISVTEGDEVEGYAHRSDLTLGGLWCNMPKTNSSRVCAPAPPTTAVAAG